MTSESKEVASGGGRKMKHVSFPTLSRVREEKLRPHLASKKLLRRDTTSLQETLYVLHELFLTKQEDISPLMREFSKLLKLAQEQAEVAEDDLVRTSFHNAELEMLFTDYKLQADDAKVQHGRAILELHQEKKRCAQKNLQVDDLRAQVAVLKAGGVCFGSRDESRSHISTVEAEELAFRIAELEALLEEQRNENTLLKAQLQQTPMSEEEASLTTDTKLQGDSFLPEYLLSCCLSPWEEEEEETDEEEEEEEERDEEEEEEEESLTDDTKQQGDSFLPEHLLSHCPSPGKEEEAGEEEESLTDDTKQQGDSFLPEHLLSHCPSPGKEEEEEEEEESLTDDTKQQGDSFLPEHLLSHCPSPGKEEEEGEEEESLTDDTEQQGDSFLPEHLLARCPSPYGDEENLTSDMNMDIAPLLEELLINSSSSLPADSVSALDQQSKDILCLSEMLSSSSAAGLTALSNGGQTESPNPKMATSQASARKETCGELLQSILQEAQQILSLTTEKLSTSSPHHDKTGPIKVQRGKVVKTELPAEASYWTAAEPLQGSCCYTSTCISSNKDITVYRQL
ncbi:Hypp2748 [Branchiostoma lanceolatum]|uniref:Hypp2748 protein n=1 Tax=Branchiostoma lanceolatum TaxID=7740 RepID=A0A8K0EUC8_BRALA|nr:Hypp2748 [Branchiostoma lanceolatum]